MTTKNGYNGYANYETWAVILWLENEQGTARYWREVAHELKEAAPGCQQVDEGLWSVEQAAHFRLADRLKDEVTDEAPDLGPSLYSDLMQAAFCEVDWHEVAEAFLEEW
jgi:hypothetical protein